MSTKHAILGIMTWGPKSGYDIKCEYETGGIQWIWRLGFGTIYPRLETLVAEGMIRPVETRTEGRERTAYDLTARGWEELDRWLETEPAYPLPLEDELLLRMFFWGTVRPDDRETLIGHLQRRRAIGLAMMERLRQSPEHSGAADEYMCMLESYARHRLEGELRWLDESIAQLEGPAQPPRQDPHGLFAGARARKEAAFREEE
ncbi:MAG TPA: helix-turn-helix transcriptional regulator [Symbiobacteriaceae bacterium]|nr:helix-turn-helix transcriptional regulator [Symbiobacteriaceae bacterium]